MNIRIVINSLIIIFIIHIIILNLDYSYNIGNGNEYNKIMTKINSNNIEQFTDDTSSIKFLTENEDDEFKKKMLKYIQHDIPDSNNNKFETKNTYPVEPSNTFLSNNNVPNFESNVADTKKFYNINYDSLDEDSLKSTSLTTLQNYNDLNKTTSSCNSNIIQEPCKLTEFGREPTKLPDTWKYKNELPMNGGSINGIYGFDNLESQFAVYNPNKINLQNSTDNNFTDIPHNDLRKPIVYED